MQPEAVLGVWPSPSQKNCGPEVLIQSQGLPDHEALWEPLAVIQEQFPSFHLEDKMPLQPEGNVRPPIHFTYSRRKGCKAPKAVRRAREEIFVSYLAEYILCVGEW